MVKEPDPESPVPQAALKPVTPAPPSLEQIFRRHASLVLSAAYRVTGRAEDAEDVLQTVFMRLARRESGAELEQNPQAYLHRAAVNAALDIVRSRSAFRSSPLGSEAANVADPTADGAERHLAGNELRDEVRRALGQLSPRAAEIFILRYFEGYENHEIAGMLGASRSTVAVVLHRARQRVREVIRPRFGD